MREKRRSARAIAAGRHASQLDRALRIRERILTAVAWRDSASLRQLARSLLALSPTVGVMKASGLGFLVRDRQVWDGLDNPTQVILRRAEAKWRAFIRTPEGKVCPPDTPRAARPFGGRRPTEFLHLVDDLAAWLSSVDEHEVAPSVVRRLAIALTLRDVGHWSHLEGWDPEALAGSGLTPAASALWLRALRKATEINSCRRAAALQRQAPPLAQPGIHVSAAEQALQLHEGRRRGHAPALRLPDGTQIVDCSPSVVISRLGEARARGLDVGTTLLEHAAALRVESQRQSLASVASGLRAWHQFAVHVLGYEPRATLPPSSGADVEKFIAVFRNGATAGNYVGFVKWTCVHLHLPVDWYTTAIAATLKGARKLNLQQRGGALSEKHLLSQEQLHQVVSLADLRRNHDFARAALVFYEFLLRIQSEGLPLQRGCSNEAVALDPCRHSAVWVVQDKLACVRLMRRKHRPQGSLLKRPCSCRKTGRQFCVVHRCTEAVADCAVGARLWHFTAAAFQIQLRQYLVLLGTRGAQSYTLKSFRAGKATALAAAGASVGQILLAGEWKSQAFLRYVDTDVVDEAAVLATALCDSDAE